MQMTVKIYRNTERLCICLSIVLCCSPALVVRGVWPSVDQVDQLERADPPSCALWRSVSCNFSPHPRCLVLRFIKRWQHLSAFSPFSLTQLVVRAPLPTPSPPSRPWPAQSEHNVSPIATVEGVANYNGTSVTSNEFDAILNILGGSTPPPVVHP